jgi:hypothetical protein
MKGAAHMSSPRPVLVAVCALAGAGLAAASPAFAGGQTVTVQVTNNSGITSPLTAVPTASGGSWAPSSSQQLAPGGTQQWVASDAGTPAGDFLGEVQWYQPGASVGSFAISMSWIDGYGRFQFFCGVGAPAAGTWTFRVDQQPSIYGGPPGAVTFTPIATDRDRPALRVRAPSSAVAESVRERGLQVHVRSNEPARARVELIARGGARHAVLSRDLRRAGRSYPLRLRLGRTGRRAIDPFDVYKLRTRVTDRAGNRTTVSRRVVIR